MIAAWSRLRSSFDAWLFEGNRPEIVPVMRIGYGLILLLYVWVWKLDAERWFAVDGILSVDAARELTDGLDLSLFFWITPTSSVVHVCLNIMLAQSLLVTLGVWSRFQMICLFIWLVSFQQRNPLINDGEDTLMRLMTFWLIWLPLDAQASLTGLLRQRMGVAFTKPDRTDAWALSLLQLQMTLIYLSATWSKLEGSTWRDGTAMLYVSYMTDFFGRIPNSQYLYDHLWFVKLSTWGALAIEALLPIMLWTSRWRLCAIGLGITLHLTIEATMSLFLFEWMMILGLISFLGRQRI